MDDYHQWQTSLTSTRRRKESNRTLQSRDTAHTSPTAPALPAESPLLFDFKEALGLAPSIRRSRSISPPSSVIQPFRPAYFSPSSSFQSPFRPSVLPSPAWTNPHPFFRNGSVTTLAPDNMAAISKTQHQCLQLSKTTAASGDRIAQRMTEYSTMIKNLPNGFASLANGLLDNCLVLSFCEFALNEWDKSNKKMVAKEAVTLENRIRAALSVFRLHDQMIGKVIEQEKKGGMKKLFGKKFEDMGAERLANVLSKTSADLRASAETFQRDLAADDMGSETGIGTTELAAVLEGANLRKKPVVTAAVKGATSQQLLEKAIEQQKQLEQQLQNQQNQRGQNTSPGGQRSHNTPYPLRNESLRIDSGAQVDAHHDDKNSMHDDRQSMRSNHTSHSQHHGQHMNYNGSNGQHMDHNAHNNHHANNSGYNDGFGGKQQSGNSGYNNGFGGNHPSNNSGYNNGGQQGGHQGGYQGGQHGGQQGGQYGGQHGGQNAQHHGNGNQGGYNGGGGQYSDYNSPGSPINQGGYNSPDNRQFGNDQNRNGGYNNSQQGHQNQYGKNADHYGSGNNGYGSHVDNHGGHGQDHQQFHPPPPINSPVTAYSDESSSSSFSPFQHDTHVRSPSRPQAQVRNKTSHKDVAHVREDSRLFSPEIEDLCGDLANLDLDSVKVARVESEPFMMPKGKARSQQDANKSNARSALISAIVDKDRKLVAYLLDRGVSPNCQNGTHPINESIAAHDLESLRLFLMYGGDPNEVDNDKTSPLALAAKRSNLHAVIALLKYGADPSISPDPHIDSPLVVAALAGDYKLVNLLLRYGGKPDQATVYGDTLLIATIDKKTPVKLIELLLIYGANANEKNREGKTALFQAITSARVDIVKKLIEYGADTNLPGPKHMLWPATYQPQCLQVLLDHGAQSKKAPGIMELAASLNNIESVRILLKAGVDPNLKKDGVYTPLCTSIRDNRGEMFKLLLANGADPNIPASEYPCFKCVTHHREQYLPALVAAGGKLSQPKGILETAVTSNNPGALTWLLDQGIDPNEKSPQGHTALSSAIRDNQVAMVKSLLHRGANPNIRGEDWPVCMAVRHPEILKLVLSRLKEPKAFKGIVEMAVAANQLPSVKLLLAAGISVEDRNGGVFSPLTTALRDRRREIVSYLIHDAGADVNAPGEHLPIVKALRRCTADPHIAMLDMLLDKGADPNKIYRGWNGIMQALENGDAGILKKLVDRAGVDLEAKDENGRSVLQIAAQREWKEAVGILKSRSGSAGSDSDGGSGRSSGGGGRAVNMNGAAGKGGFMSSGSSEKSGGGNGNANSGKGGLLGGSTSSNGNSNSTASKGGFMSSGGNDLNSISSSTSNTSSSNTNNNGASSKGGFMSSFMGSSSNDNSSSNGSNNNAGRGGNANASSTSTGNNSSGSNSNNSNSSSGNNTHSNSNNSSSSSNSNAPKGGFMSSNTSSSGNNNSHSTSSPSTHSNNNNSNSGTSNNTNIGGFMSSSGNGRKS